MGKGTIDKDYLSDFEKKILAFCKEVVNLTANFVVEEDKKNFLETWGKIGKTGGQEQGEEQENYKGMLCVLVGEQIKHHSLIEI